MVEITVNGQRHTVDAEPETPLLWVVRDYLGLTGTKFGCGMGLCGACKMHVEGQALRTCVLPVGAVAGQSVVTIEGLGAHPVKAAWIAEQVPQCGYCQPGQLMAAAAFLQTNRAPTDDDIRAGVTNLCRCGTYARIRKAIKRAAADMGPLEAAGSPGDASPTDASEEQP